MTTPAEKPAPRESGGCPQWLGAEPCHYVAQKSPSFPVFIRACSCCGRIHFGELARDLAEAGYVVVPQAELDERIRDAFVHAVAVGIAAERIGCEEDDLLAEAEQKVAATDAHFERQRATAGPEGPRGGGEDSKRERNAQRLREGLVAMLDAQTAVRGPRDAEPDDLSDHPDHPDNRIAHADRLEPCPDRGNDPDDDSLHRVGCRRTGFANDDPRLELQFGPPWKPWREAGQPELSGDETACRIVYCPTAGEDECLTHGGFDACCDRPDMHEAPREGRTCATQPEGETQQ